MKKLIILLISVVVTLQAFAANPVTADYTKDYRRLVKLEGSSNFRDLGGYLNDEGKRVVRGQLYRSGAMTSLTEHDFNVLQPFGFKTIVDLRSRDEIELMPNPWVAHDTSINYAVYDYSFAQMMGKMKEMMKAGANMHQMMYGHMHKTLKPQLNLYFNALLEQQTPIVVNCSAGQDRTGVVSALLLTLLGVPREVVIEDYLLSTDFRKPSNEFANVDYEAKAKVNDFAKMMLSYQKNGQAAGAKPLVTSEGVPFIQFVFDVIEKDYGTVENYADQELGIGSEDVKKLRELYTL
jgi:protein-tyrosine phosphatase